jgi:cellulose synthase/poly-beta-1,6-N-acetylglucosamine synthase-like glycosyltransferase
LVDFRAVSSGDYHSPTMIAFVIFLGILAVLWLGLLLSPAHRVTFSQRLDVDTQLPASLDSLPAITVIVPARNEADLLPRTIPTICRQEYPNLSVILIDDQSDDDSPNVIAQLQRDHANLHVIRATDRPAGWMGKCWAVQHGVEYAKKSGFGFRVSGIG